MSHDHELIDSDLLEVPKETKSSITSIVRNRLLNDSSIFYKGFFGMILCLAPAGIIGLILVKMSLDQSKLALAEYKNAPSQFRISSIKKVKRGRIMAYVGLALFILEIVALVTYMSLI